MYQTMIELNNLSIGDTSFSFSDYGITDVDEFVNVEGIVKRKNGIQHLISSVVDSWGVYIYDIIPNNSFHLAVGSNLKDNQQVSNLYLYFKYTKTESEIE